MAIVPPTATMPPMIGPHVVTPVVAAVRKFEAGPDPSMLFFPSLPPGVAPYHCGAQALRAACSLRNVKAKELLARTWGLWSLCPPQGPRPACCQ